VSLSVSKPLACIIIDEDETPGSELSKPNVLSEIARVPMVVRVANAVRSVCKCPISVLVGENVKSDALQERLGEDMASAVQADGASVAETLAHCEPISHGFDGNLLVLRADCPLLQSRTIAQLVQEHEAGGAALTVLVADATDQAVSGNCCVDAAIFSGVVLDQKDRSNLQEPGLTAVIDAFKRQELEVAVSIAQDTAEIVPVRSFAQLAAAEKVCWQRRREQLMADGVTLHEPETIYIDDRVAVAGDTEIWPNTYLFGETTIGSMCRIGPETYIENCSVENEVSIEFSHCVGAKVETGARIGPFSRLRPGTVVGSGDRIGNFVEIKNSQIGVKTNVSHLSYVGDATVGNNVNIGAGTITANYDGVRKHRTVIEDEASIGSNTVLVAPVTVGHGGRTGAGAVVLSKKGVPPGAISVGVPAEPLGDAGKRPDKKEPT